VYGRGGFVANANVLAYGQRSSGTLLRSQDGAHWQTQYREPNGEAFSGVAYSGGLFLAISGGSGTIYKSSDGLVWQPSGAAMPKTTYRPDGYSYGDPAMALGLFQYYDTAFRGAFSTLGTWKGSFYMAGGEGMLLQSGNTWNPATLLPIGTDSAGFKFSYTQQTDVPYRILTSTNLTIWESLYAGVGSGQPTNLTVAPSPGCPQRFFRLVSP